MLITMPQTSCSACAAAQLVSDPRAEFVVHFQRSGPSGTPWVKLQQTARGRHLPIEIGATRCPLGCRLKIRTGLLESPPTGACVCTYFHVHLHVHVHAHGRFATRQASRGPRKAGTSSSPTHHAFNASHALAGHIVTPSPLKDIHDLHVDSAGYKRGSQRLEFFIRPPLHPVRLSSAQAFTNGLANALAIHHYRLVPVEISTTGRFLLVDLLEQDVYEYVSGLWNQEVLDRLHDMAGRVNISMPGHASGHSFDERFGIWIQSRNAWTLDEDSNQVWHWHLHLWTVLIDSTRNAELTT